MKAFMIIALTLLFGEIDLEHRQGLVEAAKEGDEEARQKRVAADVEALDEVIEGLDDEGVREWVKFGMALERGKGLAPPDPVIWDDESKSALTTIGGSNRAQDAATGLIAKIALTEMNDELDKIQERLEGLREAVNANGQVRETKKLDISDRKKRIKAPTQATLNA